MSRIALASIPALTFYKDSLTASRRTHPIQQLTCIGKPCNLYTPDVVRCTNLGGVGTEVDWKCEADLPESLRFGRVEVSCEGWSASGDSYVLKGSCGLEYRLVQVPKILRNDDNSYTSRSKLQSWDIGGIIFMILWIGLLAFFLYSILKSCLRGQSGNRPSTPRRPPGSSPSSGWFPWDDHRRDDPPPYSKQSPPTASRDQTWSGWRPGFWTGAALGGLGATLVNNRQNTARTETRPWDWEQEQSRRVPFTHTTASPWRAPARNDDRGEGPSNLGAMRRSTGLGGSNVR